MENDSGSSVTHSDTGDTVLYSKIQDSLFISQKII